MTFSQFKAQILDVGFTEIVERGWPANAVLEPHSQPFEAQVRLVRGEMWLNVGKVTQHAVARHTLQLSPGEHHYERYGSAGATYWVARR